MNTPHEEKQSYEQPVLIEHGTMAQIVQSNNVCNLQDTLGVLPPVIGSEYSPTNQCK